MNSDSHRHRSSQSRVQRSAHTHTRKPRSIRDLYAAGTGLPVSSRHNSKLQFVQSTARGHRAAHTPTSKLMGGRVGHEIFVRSIAFYDAALIKSKLVSPLQISFKYSQSHPGRTGESLQGRASFVSLAWSNTPGLVRRFRFQFRVRWFCRCSWSSRFHLTD